jgi:hypothetical protein
MLFHGPINLVRSPWVTSLRDLVSIAHDHLLLVSPFIKMQATQEVVSILQRRGVDKSVRVLVLTNLRPENFLSGSTDLEALSALSLALPKFELVHLPSLHAKVYVADEQVAIVTSGNLTQSGITANLEYGVAFTDTPVVREIRRDFENYSMLGAKVGGAELDTLLRQTKDLRDAFTEAQRSMRSEARRVLGEKLEAVRVQLLRQRAKGKTTHAILSDTILFLLARVSRLSWKWRARSPVKLMEGTRETATEAPHCGREGRHPETAFFGEGADLGPVRGKGSPSHDLLPLAEGLL